MVSGVSCVELEDGELEYGEVMVADPLDVKREDVTERIRMKESFLNNGIRMSSMSAMEGDQSKVTRMRHANIKSLEKHNLAMKCQ